MAKGQVKAIAPFDEQSFPPAGSIGVIWTLVSGMTAFVPDDPAHLPPDCEPHEFGFYTFAPNEIEVLSEESMEDAKQ